MCTHGGVRDIHIIYEWEHEILVKLLLLLVQFGMGIQVGVKIQEE